MGIFHGLVDKYYRQNNVLRVTILSCQRGELNCENCHSFIDLECCVFLFLHLRFNITVSRTLKERL